MRNVAKRQKVKRRKSSSQISKKTIEVDGIGAINSGFGFYRADEGDVEFGVLRNGIIAGDGCRETFHNYARPDETLVTYGPIGRMSRFLGAIEAQIGIPIKERSRFYRIKFSKYDEFEPLFEKWMAIETPWWSKRPVLVRSLLTLFLRAAREYGSIRNMFNLDLLQETRRAVRYFLQGHIYTKKGRGKGLWHETFSDEENWSSMDREERRDYLQFVKTTLVKQKRKK